MIVLSTLILLASIGMAVYLLILDPKEVNEYRALVEKLETPQSDKVDKPYSAKQERKKVQKHIVINQEGNRLHIKLEADQSDLVLDHHEDKTEIIEHLRNVTCCMQEELYYLLEDGREVIRRADGSLVLRYSPTFKITEQVETLIPMQVIRYFEADTASFFYKTDHLVANQVKLSRFVAPGHRIVATVNGLKPFATGEAATVDFSLSGKDVHFSAKQLTARFYSNGGTP